VLSVAAYALVIATFAGALPYPAIERSTVDLLSHGIAVVNTLALACIVLGVRAVRRRRLRRHRALMLAATGLILVFLVLYLLKIGGGGTKEFVGPDVVRNYVYLPMLAVHLLLSILAVPLVVHVVVLGVSRPLRDVGDTLHPRLGRWAALAWGLSLFLGVLAYVLLNHVYDAEFVSTFVVNVL
ncbi:MAG: DUF420 domain-containing protein, partial [Halobacteriales archaeon]